MLSSRLFMSFLVTCTSKENGPFCLFFQSNQPRVLINVTVNSNKKIWICLYFYLSRFYFIFFFSFFFRIVELHPNGTWLVIVQESTRINWSELVDLTTSFDPDKVIGSCACALNNKKKWRQLLLRRSICIRSLIKRQNFPFFFFSFLAYYKFNKLLYLFLPSSAAICR
jgi:hypothetical protein